MGKLKIIACTACNLRKYENMYVYSLICYFISNSCLSFESFPFQSFGSFTRMFQTKSAAFVLWGFVFMNMIYEFNFQLMQWQKVGLFSSIYIQHLFGLIYEIWIMNGMMCGLHLSPSNFVIDVICLVHCTNIFMSKFTAQSNVIRSCSQQYLVWPNFILFYLLLKMKYFLCITKSRV